LALAQLNPASSTAQLPCRQTRDKTGQRADLVVFSSCFVAIAGGPVRRRRDAAPGVLCASKSTDGGLAWWWRLRQGRQRRAQRRRAADGHAELRFKHELPNYGVFDEKRVFTPGPLPDPVDFRGIRLGLPVCEDVWFPSVVTHLAERGAELLLVPNGSPFEVDKSPQRVALAGAARLRAASAWEPVGGRTSWFDGGFRRTRRFAGARAAVVAESIARPAVEEGLGYRCDLAHPATWSDGPTNRACRRCASNAMVPAFGTTCARTISGRVGRRAVPTGVDRAAGRGRAKGRAARVSGCPVHDLAMTTLRIVDCWHMA
jgi:hypothetical protein